MQALDPVYEVRSDAEALNVAVGLLDLLPFKPCQSAQNSSLIYYCIYLVLQRGGLDVCLA